MSNEVVARRYGRAIFEIGKEARILGSLVKEVGAFAKTYQDNDELRATLENPLIPLQARDAVIKDIGTRLGLGELALQSLRVLSHNNRLSALTAVADELSRLHDEESGVLRASVTSAAPLSSGYLDRLRGEIEKATGKKVVLAHDTDPKLIAGVVTRIGDRVIDGSLRAKLADFGERVAHA